MEKDELIKWSNFFLKPTRDIYKDHVIQLQEVIKEHNRLYYNEESPVISDREYDILFKSLNNLEESFNIFDSDSPTKRIDVIVSNQFQKGTHMSPMISLDNTYDEADLRDFEKRIRNIIKDDSKKLEYFIEFKYDGLGMSLTYENGKLIRALTRGNGIEGEDVTVNAMQFDDKFVPKTIPFNGKIEVRGEVIMTKLEFERLNKDRLEKGEKLFANPRNAASGSLRQIDYNVTKSRNLSFYAYSCPYLEDEDNRKEFAKEVNRPEVQTYKDYENALYDLGFQTQRTAFVTDIKNIDSIFDYINFLGKQKNSLDFEIDGLVIKLNDLSLWNVLGTTEHHPRYAIAYKFPAVNVRTHVFDIEHSVGRTGIITPIAHLDPVNVSGVVVSKATLHNYDELTKKDVRIGDSVFIVRAGEVIPEVVSVITESRTGKEQIVLPPLKCPSCNAEIIRDDGKVAWYCPNKKGCPAQTLGSLISFVSKHGANIEGLGDKIIELFIEKGVITDFVSIYKLQEFKEEILTYEGFKEKRIQNILDEVEASRNMNLANFLVALGIPQVGRKTAKVLEKYIGEKIEKINNGELRIENGDFGVILSETKQSVAEGSEVEGSIQNIQGPLINKENLKLIDFSAANGIEMTENVRHSEFISESIDHESSLLGQEVNLSTLSGNDKNSNILLRTLTSLNIEELEQIKDIGPIGAHSIVYYFEENFDLVQNLLNYITPKLNTGVNENTGVENNISGKSFCVTGSFEGISRDEIHEIIEKNGGEVRTSVSSKLNYLIVGSEAGSKLQKAGELGVKVLSLEEFNLLL